jgi:glyoxylase-like metal-dependent hydrolase (beta-lactamase superfamily II)
VSWTDLGGGVRVRHSAAFQMTSAVLLHARQAVVVDPGVLPGELDDLARVVAEARPAAVTLVFTHPHWDHVLGRPWFPGARTVAHDGFAAEVRREAAAIAAAAEGIAEKHGERWTRGFEPFRPDEEVSGLRFLKLDPWRLVLRNGPGHCAQQLTVHLPEARVLLAADMLSDIEIPGLDGPPSHYRRTLEELLVLAEHGAVDTLVPGHGAIARGRDAVLARFRHDLDYLAALVNAVTQAHSAGLTLAAAGERLEAMDYTGKSGTPFPMAEVHRANIAHAWREAERPQPERGARPSRGGPPSARGGRRGPRHR